MNESTFAHEWSEYEEVEWCDECNEPREHDRRTHRRELWIANTRYCLRCGVRQLQEGSEWIPSFSDEPCLGKS